MVASCQAKTKDFCCGAGGAAKFGRALTHASRAKQLVKQEQLGSIDAKQVYDQTFMCRIAVTFGRPED